MSVTTPDPDSDPPPIIINVHASAADPQQIAQEISEQWDLVRAVRRVEHAQLEVVKATVANFQAKMREARVLLDKLDRLLGENGPNAG